MRVDPVLLVDPTANDSDGSSREACPADDVDRQDDAAHVAILLQSLGMETTHQGPIDATQHPLDDSASGMLEHDTISISGSQVPTLTQAGPTAASCQVPTLNSTVLESRFEGSCRAVTHDRSRHKVPRKRRLEGEKRV